MLFAHPRLDRVLALDGEKVSTLVIENPAFFRSLLQDISDQTDGCAGEAVLSRDDVPIAFSANAELISSPLSFQLSRKPLITRLISRLEAAAVSEANYLRTSRLLGELEQYIGELSFDLPCDVTCGKLSMGVLLRSVGLDFADDYSSDLERMLDYMELTRELDRDRVFIFVNLRSFYDDSDMALFFSTALSHEYRILLVDSVSRKILPNEQRITVDDDLCEF